MLRGEWCGYPMPIDKLKLIVEKRHPLFKSMNGCHIDTPDPEPTVRQRAAARAGDRKVNLAEILAWERWSHTMNTLAVAAQECWSIDAEFRAMTKLKEMTTDQAFKCYVLSGTFLETSQRSNIIYLFRKLRPTIAMRPAQGRGNVVPIATLCLHPIGYYDKSWAGALVPTDDVIAHLTLMRGDEHGFWKKANQHPMGSASAGL